MTGERLTFLFDVDNTLIDNDRAKAELRRRLEHLLGPAEATRFWQTYDAVRAELHTVDIPRTLESFARERAKAPGGPTLSVRDRAALAGVFATFPYPEFLFPDSLAVLAALKRHGQVAILSDGDPVFQTRKIWRAGLLAAVDGAAIVVPDKTARFLDAAAFYPADRFVVVDDKAAILRAARQQLGPAVTTVHIGHGDYAQSVSNDEAAAIDVRLTHIGELPARLGLAVHHAGSH